MELEIVPRGISEKEERKNYKERGCHHDEQRQRKDSAVGAIDAGFLRPGVPSFHRRRVQQGMASGIWMCPQRDCCLKRGS